MIVCMPQNICPCRMDTKAVTTAQMLLHRQRRSELVLIV